MPENHCYYHETRIAIFRIVLDGGKHAYVCASCHNKIKGK